MRAAHGGAMTALLHRASTTLATTSAVAPRLPQLCSTRRFQPPRRSTPRLTETRTFQRKSSQFRVARQFFRSALSESRSRSHETKRSRKMACCFSPRSESNRECGTSVTPLPIASRPTSPQTIPHAGTRSAACPCSPVAIVRSERGCRLRLAVRQTGSQRVRARRLEVGEPSSVVL